MRAQPPLPTGGAVPLTTTIDQAYRNTLLPYHGWVTEKAFTVAVSAAPDWEDIKHNFAPNDEMFRADVAVFVRSNQGLLARVNQALRKLDFVDLRKSV